MSAGNIQKKKQSRKRVILQLPANGGQDCPEVLEEEKDCEAPKVCPGYRYSTVLSEDTVHGDDYTNDDTIATVVSNSYS